MSALEAKEMSEREELLSDINNLDDPYQMQPLHEDHGNEDENNEDPLVEAAMAKHLQNEKGGKDELPHDDLNLERNTFCIAKEHTSIKCGISWSFLDENKLIDLDLIVTALDIWSFEMDSVNKNHKKMFKKSVIYNKNKKNKENKDDKSIALNLNDIPENCHSLWFIINAYSGDSLKDVDKALFTIYDEDSTSLYSYDIDMGFDCGAILLGILYRASSMQNQFKWTIVEEKNLYANLIKNNLNLVYDDDVLLERPNDVNVTHELSTRNERYIIDPNLERVSIGIGWDFGSGSSFDIDIDIDASVMVFGAMEKEEDDKGAIEEDCQELDIVNNNNNFYKTYVQYININHDNAPIEKDEKKKLMHDNDAVDADANLDDDNKNKSAKEDDEQFDVYIAKMNGDNDVGSLCVLLNIFNDNNLQNKNKTNNISDCYVRLFNPDSGRELCRYKICQINPDKKTCALVLCYFRKLRNGCWYICTNDIPFKSNANLTYQQYAKQICLGKYSEKNKVVKESCCVVL
eukprot:320789_1